MTPGLQSPITDEITKKNNAIIDQCVRLDFKESSQNDDNVDIPHHVTCKKDLVGYSWDTYLIKECIDSHVLARIEKKRTLPKDWIVKKYSCVCRLCGETTEVLSTDFEISQDWRKNDAYCPTPCCSCHEVSSAEAKAMDILNKLGITYIREKTFDGLTGYRKALRFDFALFRTYEERNNPKIDLVIELHGPHHYEKGYYDEDGFFDTDCPDERASRNLKRQQAYDKKKEEYCSQHGIALACIRIPESISYQELKNKLLRVLHLNRYDYYDSEGADI